MIGDRIGAATLLSFRRQAAGVTLFGPATGVSLLLNFDCRAWLTIFFKKNFRARSSMKRKDFDLAADGGAGKFVMMGGEFVERCSKKGATFLLIVGGEVFLARNRDLSRPAGLALTLIGVRSID